MEEQTQNQESSIKLMKMSKGYNWEIKSYNQDLDKAREEILKQDKELKKIFNNIGGQENE